MEEIHALALHELGTEKYRRLGMKYRMTEIHPPSKREAARIPERIQVSGSN
jgi:pyruvate-formate lyase-activating enzyme